jgi:hypothetical protein
VLSSPVLPLTIALGALTADGAGAHHLAFYVVLLAVPAAAGAALSATADLADGRHVAGRMACTAGALVLLIVSSAARANAPAGSSVPAIAVSALIGCILAYASLGVLWLARPVRWNPGSPGAPSWRAARD